MATHSRVSGSADNGRRLPATTVAAAVFFALYGIAPPALADPTDANAGTLQEVVVTANRRQQTLEAVPYSISVVSADQIAASGADDMMSFAAQVPGLSMYDYGARFA